LDYEKPVSTNAQAKISIGSFLPFSTASIETGRNKIVVLNRNGLEKMAGYSYGVPEKEYRRLIG
jgi:hypothetical protein